MAALFVYIRKQMNAAHSLLIQKMTEGAPLKDIENDFNMVCLSFPFRHSGERKETAFNDWKDEDGEDVYTSCRSYRSAYDIEAEFGYKGDKAGVYAAIRSFLDYLDGMTDGCGFMKIYQSHTGIGRRDVYLKEISGEELTVTPVHGKGNEGILTFRLTFRVCDPVTEIIYAGGKLTESPAS